MDNRLYATFFGRFALARPNLDGERVITEQERSSQRMWTFLEYLCAFHRKPVEQEEVINAIWGEDEVADPVGALKTILHRARATLEELGFPNGKQVLLYRRGYYSWAPEVEVWSDADELDRLCAEFDADPAGALPTVLAFLPRYQADFLPNAGGSSWVLSLRTWYHNQFLHLVQGAAKRLGEGGEYDEGIRLCRTATTLDPYDERCQIQLMRLLHGSGATQSALWHYRSVSRLYLDHLGTTPSDEMVACFRELARSNETENQDLLGICERLREPGRLAGPLFCDFATFQEIYRLTCRFMSRFESPVQLVLLTLLERDGSKPNPKRCAAATEELERSGLSCLRLEDVYTRLNTNQYLLLMPSADRENARMALARFLSTFENTLVGRTITVKYGFRPVQGRKLTE